MYVLRIECTRRVAVGVEVALDAAGADVTRWDEAEQDRVCFEEYFDDAVSARARKVTMQGLLEQNHGGEPLRMEMDELADRDWQEAWKATIHAARISDRIVIKPPWEVWSARPDDCVIEIEPGMSFGTGLHFTTRSCLRFIDRILKNTMVDRFCDLGCGSGILSIAAIKLGVRTAFACDLDPVAIRVAGENSRRNGVGACIETEAAALSDLDAIGSYPLVAANILAHVLRDEIDTISAAVAPGGHLMLAGTTVHDFAAIGALYEARGFVCVADDADSEWRSGLFEKK